MSSSHLHLVRRALPAFFFGLAACGPLPSTLLAPPQQACTGAPPAPAELRVVSFNIRSGLSSSVDRIGDFLAGLDADVIALEEVDMGVKRTGRAREAEVLAKRLGYEYAFAASIDRGGGEYGVAMLSRLPIARASRIDLRAPGEFEPRVAIDADLCAGERSIRVVAVHADIFPWSAEQDTRELAAAITRSVGQGVIVAGDLNSTPAQEPVQELVRAGLTDVLARYAEGPTFGGNRRIDYILTDGELEAVSAQRLDVALSDHRPILATLRLR